jgi:hypothetical protein
MTVFNNDSPKTEARFAIEFGYLPNGIYCEVTGKLIGIIEADEFQGVTELLAGLPHETAMSDLRLKVLASMRPSMKWIKMRDDSLDVMRKQYPVETMAYLLNRLFDPAKSVMKPMGWDTIREDRIYLHAWLHQFYKQMTHVPGSAWEQVFVRLIELHAKFDLKNEIAPFTCEDLLSLSMDSFMVDMLALLTPWHRRRVKDYEDRLDRAELVRTNPMARRAFLNTWAEQSPPSHEKVKRDAKQKEANVLDALLAEIMGEPSQVKGQTQSPPTASPGAPTARSSAPSSKMPSRFGVKKA